MKIPPRFSPASRHASYASGLLSLLLPLAANAQLPPGVADQLRNTQGNRIEAATILGGDFGMNGASYKGDNGNTLDLQKFGGAGDVGDPKQLWNLPIGWQPRLQGNMGWLSSKNEFNNDPLLNGSQSKFHDYSIQFGGGARFWFSDAFSIAPTIMGMYGHTKNDFYPGPGVGGGLVSSAQNAGLIDWDTDSWTIRPAADIQYIYTWRRTIFTLSSDPTYFHTESFNASNPNISVNGDSETWVNKLDVDIPLGKDLFGHELRTGGYFSRSDFYGDIKDGLNVDHLYEAHGRLVLDFLNQLWKVQWIGIGGSYLWGHDFHGYSYGLDIAFRF